MDNISEKLVAGACISVEKCKCVYCLECRGTGKVEYRTGLYPEWDLESCSSCYGTGISEMCTRCEMVEELAEGD